MQDGIISFIIALNSVLVPISHSIDAAPINNPPIVNQVNPTPTLTPRPNLRVTPPKIKKQTKKRVVSKPKTETKKPNRLNEKIEKFLDPGS